MGQWQPMVEEVVMTRYRDLLAYAHMLTGQRADAEDLVQEALIETFGRPRSFPNPRAAEGYVRRVIASRFVDSRRRRTIEGRLFKQMGTTEADGSAGPDLLVEHATDVGAALATLAPRERTCIVLRYVEHLSIRETAEVLDLSEGSVKRYVSDGIAKLNGLLGTLDGPELTEWVDVKVGR